MPISSIGSIGSSDGYDPTTTASQIASKMMKDLDANGDGSINKAEFVSGMKTKGVSEVDAAKLFDSIDTKGSGKITQSDIETAINKQGSLLNVRMHSRGGGRMSGEAPAGGSPIKVYDPRDLNQDGKVTAEEARRYAAKYPRLSNIPVSASSVGKGGTKGGVDATA
jgi:Ca2+-binding EF-hand superfamily protein